MKTLDKIVKELARQVEEGQLLYFNRNSPFATIIDGHINLVALARAIDEEDAPPPVVAAFAPRPYLSEVA